MTTRSMLLTGSAHSLLMQAENEQGSDFDLLEAIKQTKALVDSGDINLADYRGYYKQVQGAETTLTDDGIIALIAATEDEQSVEEWAGLMRAAESSNQPPVTTDDAVEIDDDETSQRLSISVYAAADAFSKNAKAVKEAEEYSLAPEKMKFNPADIAKLGMSGKIEGFRKWPVVGSKRIEGTAQPYDVYKRKANDGTELNGSWFDDWAARTVLGQSWLKDRDMYQKALENVEGADPELVKLPKNALSAKVKALDARLRQLAKCARTASNIYRAFEAIKVAFPKITLDFQLTGSDEDAWSDRDLVEGIAHPFWIADNTNKAKSDKLAVSELLRFNTKKATDAIAADPKLSQYDAIRATAKKKKGRKAKGQNTEDKTGTGEDSKGLLTLLEFPTWVQRGANLMDWASEKGSENISMLANAASKWSDDDVQSFATIRAAMDVIWNRAELNDRLDKITSDKSAAEKAARKAEQSVKDAAKKVA